MFPMANVRVEVLEVELDALGVDAKDHGSRLAIAHAVLLGDLGDAPFERCMAAHAQRRKRIEHEERAAADDHARP